MTRYLFPTFLSNREDYERAVQHWHRLWEQVDPISRSLYGWRTPWFSDGPEDLQDGNPIFTAISDDSSKAIRIIQASSGRGGVEFAMWLDTFGGSAKDPDTITELVIACVLSPQTSATALRYMTYWVMAGVAKTIDLPPREAPLGVGDLTIYAVAA